MSRWVNRDHCGPSHMIAHVRFAPKADKNEQTPRHVCFVQKADRTRRLQTTARGQPPAGLGLRQTRSNGSRQAWGATS